MATNLAVPFRMQFIGSLVTNSATEVLLVADAAALEAGTGGLRGNPPPRRFRRNAGYSANSAGRRIGFRLKRETESSKPDAARGYIRPPNWQTPYAA